MLTPFASDGIDCQTSTPTDLPRPATGESVHCDSDDLAVGLLGMNRDEYVRPLMELFLKEAGFDFMQGK